MVMARVSCAEVGKLALPRGLMCATSLRLPLDLFELPSVRPEPRAVPTKFVGTVVPMKFVGTVVSTKLVGTGLRWNSHSDESGRNRLLYLI